MSNTKILSEDVCLYVDRLKEVNFYSDYFDIDYGTVVMKTGFKTDGYSFARDTPIGSNQYINPDAWIPAGVHDGICRYGINISNFKKSLILWELMNRYNVNFIDHDFQIFNKKYNITVKAGWIYFIGTFSLGWIWGC